MPMQHLYARGAQEHILNVDSCLVIDVAEVGVDIVEK
jgi:hypothetical protein